MGNKNLIFGLIWILLGLGLFFVIIPSQVPDFLSPGDIPASFFPKLSAFSFIVLGILFLIASRRTNEKKDEKDINSFAKSSIGLLLMFLFVFFVKNIGFYIVSFCFMIILLSKLSNLTFNKSLFSTILFLLFCYALFEIGLKLTLPRGILF